jgi:hypothetical protein
MPLCTLHITHTLHTLHTYRFCAVDCAQETRGLAVVDDCLQCSLGTTGVAFNSLKDCMGVCNGPYVLDDGVIDPLLTGNDTNQTNSMVRVCVCLYIRVNFVVFACRLPTLLTTHTLTHTHCSAIARSH